MDKGHYCSLIVFSLCSFITDFLTKSNGVVFYPRDRIIHLVISLFLNWILIYILSEIEFNRKMLKSVCAVIFVLRIICTAYRYCEYYMVFHGSNTFGIVIFTFITVLLAWGTEQTHTEKIYIFMIISNVVLAIIIFLLCLKTVAVENLYSNDTGFNFSAFKLWFFFDILTISFLTEKGKKRKNTAVKYTAVSSMIILTTTLLQGLCVTGNILYSLTPLQSLVQIFSSYTIKRYDYILTGFFTVNYFGTLILYGLLLKKLTDREKDIENS